MTEGISGRTGDPGPSDARSEGADARGSDIDLELREEIERLRRTLNLPVRTPRYEPPPRPQESAPRTPAAPRIDEMHAVLTRLQASIEDMSGQLDSLRKSPLFPPANRAPAGDASGPPVLDVAFRTRGGWKRWSAGAALALALAAAFASWRLGAVRSPTLPSAHPAALAFSGRELWVADWYDQAVYRLDTKGGGFEVVARYPLPDTHAVGLALAGTHLFVADPWRKEIQRRRLDERLTLETAVPSPGPKPSALYFDGRYLWSADKEARRIYRHDLDDALTVLDVIETKHEPIGLSGDGRRLWSLGEQDGILYRHGPRGAGLAGAYLLPEAPSGEAPVSTFAWKHRRLFLGWDGLGTLTSMPSWRLKRIQ